MEEIQRMGGMLGDMEAGERRAAAGLRVFHARLATGSAAWVSAAAVPRVRPNLSKKAGSVGLAFSPAWADAAVNVFRSCTECLWSFTSWQAFSTPHIEISSSLRPWLDGQALWR